MINESLDLLVLYWEIFLLNLVENLQPESSLINGKVKHVKLLLKLSFVDFMAILIIPFGTMLVSLIAPIGTDCARTGIFRRFTLRGQ